MTRAGLTGRAVVLAWAAGRGAILVWATGLAGMSAAAQTPPAVHGLHAHQPPILVAQQDATAPAAAFLASALLPGAGQYLLESERWIPYAVVEAWAWLSYADRRSDTRKLEARYRELARSVPRRVSAGARPDTVFEYYEALDHYTASGAWDVDPAQPGIQPEEDPRTFNGEIWQLAVGLYVPAGTQADPQDPAYQAALAFYMEHAIPPGYAWAWGNNDLERQVFRELIRGSDEAFRDATTLLGAILANHLVSAVDAFVLARLRGADGAPILRIRSSLGGTFDRPRWSAAFELHFQ